VSGCTKSYNVEESVRLLKLCKI